MELNEDNILDDTAYKLYLSYCGIFNSIIYSQYVFSLTPRINSKFYDQANIILRRYKIDKIINKHGS